MLIRLFILAKVGFLELDDDYLVFLVVTVFIEIVWFSVFIVGRVVFIQRLYVYVGQDSFFFCDLGLVVIRILNLFGGSVVVGVRIFCLGVFYYYAVLFSFFFVQSQFFCSQSFSIGCFGFYGQVGSEFYYFLQSRSFYWCFGYGSFKGYRQVCVFLRVRSRQVVQCQFLFFMYYQARG